MVNEMNIGKDIHDIRVKAGMTQRQVADAADISQSNLSGIEHGKTTPTIPMLILITDALGCRLDVRIVRVLGSAKNK